MKNRLNRIRNRLNRLPGSERVWNCVEEDPEGRWWLYDQATRQNRLATEEERRQLEMGRVFVVCCDRSKGEWI